MRRNKALLYMMVVSILMIGGPSAFAEQKKMDTGIGQSVSQIGERTEKPYLDGKFPGLSPDFKILDKDQNIRQGSMTVVVVKDGKIESLRTRYLKGTQLKKESYPEYLKEYEQTIVDKGLDGAGELKGHEEEGRVIRSLVEDALKRSQGYADEFRLGNDSSKPMKDGTYLGKHHGFYPGEEFLVKVIVKDNAIEEVDLLNKADDNYIREEKYLGNGKFINSFKGKKDANVDTVTGATFSSKGVQKAVENALKKAQK